MPDQPYATPTPTMLIGLGGLGSSIVQSVYEGLDDRTRKSTRAHVLDTDALDVRDERFDWFRNQRWQTQTSRNILVQDCVRQLALQDAVRKWFPTRAGGGLIYKQMVRGASQIRAVSRLAWVDTLNSERIRDFNSNLDGLFQIRADNVDESARVMIVNSIAGGTGTGLFLQVALYVREYLMQRGISSVTVRGFAVMPEVFIQNGDYASEDLRSNVRANAYAVLKELDALIRVRAGAFADTAHAHLSPLYPLELEYKPLSRTPTVVEPGQPPFDVVTLFDFTGSGGDNLSSKFNYIAQVQDAMRLHLFSPLAGRGGPDSQEDNLALTYLARGDRSRFAGCGTASVEYPFEDLVEYGALRWATDGISAKWMELDELITDETRRAAEDRRQGIAREMPDPHTRFGELLRDKGAARRNDQFYSPVFKDTQLLNDKGEAVAPKHELWLDAVERNVKEIVRKAVEDKVGELPDISMDLLRDRENVVSQVQQIEEGLRRYARAVDNRIQPVGTALAREAMWAPFDRDVDCVQNADTQPNTWMLARQQPMHPLAMRYFLVESRNWLSKRLASLQYELKRVGDTVEGYEGSWDDSSTEELEEGAADVARKIAERWYEVLVRSLPKFAEDYHSRAEAQRRNIEKRAELVALNDTFGDLLRNVEALADAWRNWFLSLGQVRHGAADRVAYLESQHERSADPTRVFVYASAAIKRKVWEQQSAERAATEFPPDIAREMYRALYRSLGEEVRTGLRVDRPSGWVQELFERSVLKWCKQELRRSPAFDMDVSSAIKAEWGLNRALGISQAARSDEEAFVAYLRQLEALAKPWLDTSNQGQQFLYLCMHPTAAGRWGDKLLGQHAKIRYVHPGFSPYRISRMVVVQAVLATELRSMVGAQSPYRAAYDERIRRAREQPPTAVTPHLDFRWDSPAFLPELDDAEQARAIRDIYRAAVLTLADRLAGRAPLVFEMQLDLRRVWAWSPSRGVADGLRDSEEHTAPATTFRLVDVLAANYWLVRRIVEEADDLANRHLAQPGSSSVIAGLGQLVDAVARVPGETRDAAAGSRRQRVLLQALFDEVYEVHFRDSGMPETARQAAATILEGVWRSSEALKTEPKSAFAEAARRSIRDVVEPRSQ